MDPEVDHHGHHAEKIFNSKHSDKILRIDPFSSDKESGRPPPSTIQADTLSSDVEKRKPKASITRAETWPRKLYLLLGLAAGIALSAIAAGVAGSIAVQRQHELTSWEPSSVPKTSHPRHLLIY